MTWQRTFIILIFLSSLLASHTAGQQIEVRKLDINTSGSSDLAPVLHDSTLYFISNRRSRILVNYLDQNAELLYRLFRAKLNTDGTYDAPALFAPPDQPRFNAGPITFSANGATMIATHNLSTRLQQGRKEREQNLLGLYSAQKRRNLWQQYQKISIANSQYSTGHPSLSRDGQLLFFVSDMEGGEGNTDIYVSRKTADGWSKPENAGPNINTPGKELFPFIHSSGKLFFTSDGHQGKGGLDIYYIEWDKPGPMPIAMPSPINSNSNDFSCFIGEDEEWGYFASDRSGDDDIYKYELHKINCTNAIEVTEDNFCFTFFEDGASKSDTLPHIYRWDFGDGQQKKGLEVDHCFPGPGNYNISLHVVDTLLNEELFSVASYNLDLKLNRQIWFEAPDTIKTGQPLNLEASIRGFEEIPENPVFYWNFDTGERRIGKQIAYTYTKPGNYRITCSTRLNDNREICFFRDIIVIDDLQD